MARFLLPEKVRVCVTGGALDTLNELAAALGDDPDFAATVTNGLAGKLAIAANLADLADPGAKPSLRAVQQKLKDLGYHEVGAIDGLFGPRTRAGILAFKADNGLPLTPDVDVAFITALEKAPPRAIAPERANGKPQASRIVSAANAQIASGIAGTIAIAGAAIAPAIEAAEQAKDMTERAIGLLNLTEFVAPFLPWIGIAIFAVVIVLAWRARAARIEDYRTGKTP